MHSETINHRLVAVEKIDSQKTIHARTSGAAAPVGKIPGPHGMCSRLIRADLKIFDFATFALAGQPHETIHIFFAFREWHSERSQCSRRDNSPVGSCIDDKTGGSPVQFARDVKIVTCPLQR